MSENRTAMLRLVRPLYAGRDPAHGIEHVERLLARAADLADGLDPAPRPELVEFLACFHGLVRTLREEAGLASEVRAFLADRGWSPEATEEAFAALDRHLEDPRTPEEEVVHDANALETLGALGVAKAFTTGGSRGQSYEETAAIFARRLAQAELRTPRGRALSDEGRAYAQAFLRRLETEW